MNLLRECRRFTFKVRTLVVFAVLAGCGSVQDTSGVDVAKGDPDGGTLEPDAALENHADATTPGLPTTDGATTDGAADDCVGTTGVVGTACDDHNACTVNDICTRGHCAGSPACLAASVISVVGPLTETSKVGVSQSSDSAPRVDDCGPDRVLLGLRLWQGPSGSDVAVYAVQAICGKIVVSGQAPFVVSTVATGNNLAIEGKTAGASAPTGGQDVQCPDGSIIYSLGADVVTGLDAIKIACAKVSITGGPGAFAVSLKPSVNKDWFGGSDYAHATSVVCPDRAQVARGIHVGVATSGLSTSASLECINPTLATALTATP